MSMYNGTHDYENQARNLTTPCPDTEDAYEAVKLCNFCFTLIVSVFGLISNGIVVAVNKRISKWSSTDVYLTFLAISDNIVIIVLSLYSYRYVYSALLPAVSDWTTGGYVSIIGLLLEHFFQFVNTYVIVLLSLDRFIQVRCVVQSKKWCKPRAALHCLVYVVLAGTLFTLPRLWEYIPLLQHPSISIDKCDGYFSFTHGLGQIYMYRLLYGFVGYLFVMYFIPLVVLTVTNYTLISVICKRRRWLKKIHTEREIGAKRRIKKTEANAILTLIIVTLTFMVLQIPDMVLQFIWRISPDHGPTASIFAFQLMIVNSSINFIIYSLSSKIFRKRLNEFFKNCSGAKRNSSWIHGTVFGEHEAGQSREHELDHR